MYSCARHRPFTFAHRPFAFALTSRTILGLSCRFSVRRYRIIPTYLYSHDRRRDVMSPLNMVHLYDAIFDLLKKILPEGENGRSDMFWTPLTIL